MTKELTGVIKDLPPDDYYSHPDVSTSDLRLVAQSPAHYFARRRAPDREQISDDTPAKKIGRAFHCAVLEPGEFDNRYTAIPEGLDRRTKEGKALWQSIIESGREPLPADTLATVLATARAALAHPVSQLVFAQPGGLAEASLFWTDIPTGVPMRARLDYHLPPSEVFPNGLIIDLKSAEDASPEAFGRSAWTYEMHLQASIYPDGFQACYYTAQPPDFLWLAVEKEPPYATAYYSATNDLTGYGRREYRRLLEVWRGCEATGRWPGYGDTIRPIELPAWAQKVITGDAPGVRA